MTITVLIADDHKLMRQGLHALVDEQSDMKVIGQAENGKAAVELVAKLSPQVVLMDISMPGLGGVDATRQIVSPNGVTKIIGLSMHVTKELVLDMLHAGAKTVELDRQKVMSKLNISTTAELVKFALRIGLTTLNP